MPHGLDLPVALQAQMHTQTRNRNVTLHRCAASPQDPRTSRGAQGGRVSSPPLSVRSLFDPCCMSGRVVLSVRPQDSRVVVSLGGPPAHPSARHLVVSASQRRRTSRGEELRNEGG